jgi:hypothetical protein
MNADDGSSFSFGQTIPVTGVNTILSGNTPDVQLTFGSRFTYAPNVGFISITCDATALIRGPRSLTCPR